MASGIPGNPPPVPISTMSNPLENGKCVLTGNASTQRVLFARAY